MFLALFSCLSVFSKVVSLHCWERSCLIVKKKDKTPFTFLSWRRLLIHNVKKEKRSKRWKREVVVRKRVRTEGSD